MPKLKIFALTIAIAFISVISAQCDQSISNSEKEKYERIDNNLKEVSSNLPSWDGGNWVWLSAKRIDDTIIYEYRAFDSYKGRFDHDFYKNSIIKIILEDEELVSDQMKFKMIYTLPNNKENIVNIAPEDYLIKQ